MNTDLLKSNTGAVLVLSAVTAIAIYYAQKKAADAYNVVDNAVDGVIDPLSMAFFSSELVQGKGVEIRDFKISFLHRDFFDNAWRIRDDVYLLYSRQYPDEMREILTPELILKEQFRNQIGA